MTHRPEPLQALDEIGAEFSALRTALHISHKREAELAKEINASTARIAESLDALAELVARTDEAVNAQVVRAIEQYDAALSDALGTATLDVADVFGLDR